MADVIRLNHGVLSGLYRKEQGESFYVRIMKHLSAVERKCERASMKDADEREGIYKIQAYLIQNVVCGSC